MVEYQKGDINKIKVSKKKVEIKSKKSGVVEAINALEVGKVSLALGAGKVSKSDSIDYTVGVELNKLVGDSVKKGDVIATLYVGKKEVDFDIERIFTIK
jgi:thymidine phosphorylase